VRRRAETAVQQVSAHECSNNANDDELASHDAIDRFAVKAL
jgi:hypothetical protein